MEKERADGCMDVWMEKVRADGWMYDCMDGWIDGWMDGKSES